MTREEAFEAFIQREDMQLSYQRVLSNCWNAACEWQKNKDADLMLKVASTFGAPDAYWIFADTIRDQE